MSYKTFANIKEITDAIKQCQEAKAKTELYTFLDTKIHNMLVSSIKQSGFPVYNRHLSVSLPDSIAKYVTRKDVYDVLQNISDNYKTSGFKIDVKCAVQGQPYGLTEQTYNFINNIYIKQKYRLDVNFAKHMLPNGTFDPDMVAMSQYGDVNITISSFTYASENTHACDNISLSACPCCNV